jgi:hypothetical protein
MDIAGHVSKQMLKHYSHIRMEAKRRALESIVTRRPVEESSQETGLPEGVPTKVPTIGFFKGLSGGSEGS